MTGKKVSFAAKPQRQQPDPSDVDMFVAAGIETPLPVAPAPKAAAMKRLTIDIDADLHRRLKVACAADGQKMADFIRDLIGKHLP